MLKIGVLALQGDFEAHARALARVGADPVMVRTGKDLDGLDALVLPGGESTTIAKGMERLGLFEAIRAFAEAGHPILGTCAGAILLARRVENHPVSSLGLLDMTAVRNAYGTQVDSFVAPADPGAKAGLEGLPCVFIRAPRLRDLGREVDVLVRVGGEPVLVRRGERFAATFHPELGEDPRVLRLWIETVRRSASAARSRERTNPLSEPA